MSALRGRLSVLLLILVVFVNGLAHVGASPIRMVDGTDSGQYDLFARNIELDRGFSSAGPPYDPTIYREPGYPLVVAVVYRVTHEDVDAVARLQVGLLALTSGLIALLGWQLLALPVGLVAGALYGLSPEMVNASGWVLSETDFTFLFLASLVLGIRAQRTGTASGLLVSGFGLGLATLTRAIAGTLLLPMALLLALPARRPGRAFGVRAAAVLIGATVVVAPWIARNWMATGHPTFTSRGGVALIKRFPRAAEPLGEYLPEAIWVATNPLSNLVVPISHFQWGPQPEDNRIWDFHVNDSVRYMNRYDAVCQAAPGWDECATEISLGFIRAYPVQSLLQSFFELVKLLFAPLPGPSTLAHNGTVWLGFIGMGMCAARHRLDRAHAAVLGSFLAYLAASSVGDAQVRYSEPVLPIIALYAAVAILDPVTWLARRLRPTSPARLAARTAD